MLEIYFDSSEVKWFPNFSDIKNISLRRSTVEIKAKPTSQIKKTIENTIDKLMENIEKFEKDFQHIAPDSTGSLEFQISIIPKSLDRNLFDENSYSSLKNILNLGIFDILYILFSNFGYMEDLILSI